MIADGPPATDLPQQWLVLRVDDPAEVPKALDLLAQGRVQGLYLFTTKGLPLWEEFCAAHKLVQAAGGLVADEQGRLLAIHRLGKWDLPKGKVDPGEAIPEAAMREVREECGLRTLELLGPMGVTWHTYVHKGRPHLKRTDWFHMRASASEDLVPQVEEDIQEVRWLDADGVARMRSDTYPSLLPLLEAWTAR